MYEDKLTPKERWLAVLGRKKPDRIPMDYWATDETTQMLMQHLQCPTFNSLMEKLHVDYLVKARPAYTGPPLEPDEDAYGCRFRWVNYGSGRYKECIHHPLKNFTTVEEIEGNYVWPDPDWWDYRSLKKQIQAWDSYPVQAGDYEPLLTYKHLRGDEQAYLDLALNPDMVHYCLDKLFYLGYEEILRSYEQIGEQVVTTYVAEDMGAQNGLLIAPEQIRAYLLPRMEKIIRLVHENGVYVFHHNDGSIRKILPDLIQAGIDILNPIQWRCTGMDRRVLKKEFGSDVIFHGAMDNQETLPFGSIEDVRSEVRDNMAILGSDGAYIMAPCHNLQPLTPPENISAMYETCFREGRF
jgi:uroporphyrinogen decarboxylase